MPAYPTAATAPKETIAAGLAKLWGGAPNRAREAVVADLHLGALSGAPYLYGGARIVCRPIANCSLTRRTYRGHAAGVVPPCEAKTSRHVTTWDAGKEGVGPPGRSLTKDKNSGVINPCFSSARVL